MANGRSPEPRRDADGPGDRRDDDRPGTSISVCETSPGRVVFTDEHDTDAWIATDLVVEVER